MSKNLRRISLLVSPCLSDAIDAACAANNGIPVGTLCLYFISKGLHELGFVYPDDHDEGAGE